jgi:hypothetical protein
VTHENDGLAQARAARERAKQALEEVQAQRPEVKAVVKKSIQLRQDNHFSEMWIKAAVVVRGSGDE